MKTKYRMEELLPIVAKLSERFTSGESSSITYEQAAKLMGAVVYCIEEAGESEDEHALSLTDRQNVSEVYALGYQKVLDKVQKAKELYALLMTEFRDFGNENYRDTVRIAIPGFFKYYSAMYAPQDTIISMDYQTVRPVVHVTGIDAVYEYLDRLLLEQTFMQPFPETYIADVLRQYHKDYKKYFFNLCEILLRHEIIHRIQAKKELYDRVQAKKEMRDKDGLELICVDVLSDMIAQQYDGNEKLKEYFLRAMRDIACELCEI